MRVIEVAKDEDAAAHVLSELVVTAARRGPDQHQCGE
jgi:hypothetical protein